MPPNSCDNPGRISRTVNDPGSTCPLEGPEESAPGPHFFADPTPNSASEACGVQRARVHLRWTFRKEEGGRRPGERERQPAECSDSCVCWRSFTVVGTRRAAAAEVSREQVGREAARGSPSRARRRSLRAANGLSVEGGPCGVRLRQHAAPVLPRDRLGLAEPGRGDDEGAAGRGKKPVPIRRTAASPGPSVPFLRMETAYPSRWSWPAPTRMTCDSSSRRSEASPYGVLGPSRGEGSSTSAGTRGTTTKTSETWRAAGATPCTSNHGARRLMSAGRILGTAHGAGSWSAVTRG